MVTSGVEVETVLALAAGLANIFLRFKTNAPITSKAATNTKNTS